MARVYNQALRPWADFARVQQKLSRNAACRNRMMKTKRAYERRRLFTMGQRRDGP